MTHNAISKHSANRWRSVLFILIGIIFLFAFFVGSLSAVEFTQSSRFCSTCHVMKPEVTVYRNSPHARTECGICHRGPGALPIVKAEMQNLRYLWVYPLNLYPKPIPSPIHSLRPVEVVCEQCHWPQKFYENRLVTLSRYGQDEANSLTQTALLLKTGGGRQDEGRGRGIHWHIENPVYYIATDEKRQEIPWVQAEFGGVVTEYLAADSNLTPEQIAQAEKRKMDCVDCHNRATHVFRRPAEALDEALANGTIPADLPAIKQQGTAVLERTYASEEEAARAVAAVTDFYRTTYPDVYAQRQADVQKAVAALQELFDQTQFPFMRVTWETHPNNIGHKDSPGCFRCHDGKHLSADNQAIRLECNICHSIPQVADPGKPLPALQITAMKEPESHRSTTWLSEHRVKFDASCTDCHTVDNPGGSDNSSFCSNSACHATEWQYVGLDAPKVRQLITPPEVPSKGVPGPIPHPIGPRTDCAICHGPDAVRPAPESHAGFAPDSCTSCHKPTLEESPAVAVPATPTPEVSAGAAPVIPHDLAGRDDCLPCHDPASTIKPAPQDHVGRTIDACQLCHRPLQ